MYPYHYRIDSVRSVFAQQKTVGIDGSLLSLLSLLSLHLHEADSQSTTDDHFPMLTVSIHQSRIEPNAASSFQHIAT
jgi:hypothetical protein